MVERSWWVPEVVQTSNMDCGPASLKALLGGFGVNVSYGRLREACQTSVDGTSIDTLEDLAVMLGLDAEQVVVPRDHVLRAEGGYLPALAVITLPQGLTHFVIIWRVVGGFALVMDPASGRRWMRLRALQELLYVHQMPVPAEGWRSWAAEDEFRAPLVARLGALGVDAEASRGLLDRAYADPDWRSIAALDATVRMVEALGRVGAVRAGPEAGRAVAAIVAQAASEEPPVTVPPVYWSAVAPSSDPPAAEGTEGAEEAEPSVIMRGAVLLRVRGLKEPAADAAPVVLPSELRAALDEAPTRPLQTLWGMLREDGHTGPLRVGATLLLVSLGLLVEALLFRALYSVAGTLGPAEQKLGGVLAIVVFAGVMLALEGGLQASVARMGRHLEGRFRLAFFRKIPLLGDRYFQSRQVSDMTQRSHSVSALRRLPAVGAGVVRSAVGLGLTTVAITWMDPALGPLALLVAAISVAVPLLVQPLLNERDLRFRTQAGSLMSLYLDALLGLMAIRTHGAERTMRREHESLLVEWRRSGLSLQDISVLAEGVEALLGLALSALLLFRHVSGEGGGEGELAGASGALLVAWWALQLPAQGLAVAQGVRQYPALRNVAYRLMEPLGAPEEAEQTGLPSALPPGALSLRLEGVGVVAGGNRILDGIDLDIARGSHVGIVGPSGAGKSSLVGLLLGWHKPVEGVVLIDGQPLDSALQATLRQRIAWVDPDVHLWNQPLLDNLLYGNDGAAAASIGDVLEEADLRSVLEELPEGLQTPLGESGGLLSGGQGQRVRLGRALLRKDVGLVILDEPFRGLDRDKRRILLARARERWKGVTLLCITHDVGDTEAFDRVLVIEGGRVAEDGDPALLRTREDSRWRALQQAEEAVRRGLWESAEWRHLWLEGGRLGERP